MKAEEALRLKLQSGTEPVLRQFSGSGMNTIVAPCPPDTVLARGGFSIPSGNPEIRETAPEGNGWAGRSARGPVQHKCQICVSIESRSGFRGQSDFDSPGAAESLERSVVLA